MSMSSENTYTERVETIVATTSSWPGGVRRARFPRAFCVSKLADNRSGTGPQSLGTLLSSGGVGCVLGKCASLRNLLCSAALVDRTDPLGPGLLAQPPVLTPFVQAGGPYSSALCSCSWYLLFRAKHGSPQVTVSRDWRRASRVSSVRRPPTRAEFPSLVGIAVGQSGEFDLDSDRFTAAQLIQIA